MFYNVIPPTKELKIVLALFLFILAYFYLYMCYNQSVTSKHTVKGNKMTFNELQLSPALLRAIQKAGFTHATQIQDQCIEKISANKDIIGQSQTGSGKTAAFVLPILDHCLKNQDQKTTALILCPTRELALQITQHIRMFTGHLEDISTVTVYGGESIEKQIRQLKKSTNIIVGTPGRLLDHLSRKTIRLDNIQHVVLDEADEMLNMGFIEDIEKILSKIPTKHQTSLFSATMPKAIVQLSQKFLHQAEHIIVESKTSSTEHIKQYAYEVDAQNKNELLFQLLSLHNPDQAMIFCNTKKMVDELTVSLQKMDVACVGLHGDMRQETRTHIMKQFKEKKASLLIATDVAARGIDVDSLDLVINYDLPQQDEFYIHRIGRSGRAGNNGCAITLYGLRQRRSFEILIRKYDLDIEFKGLPTAEELFSITFEQLKAKLNKNQDISTATYDIAHKLLLEYHPEELLYTLLQQQLVNHTHQPIKTKKKKTRSNKFVTYEINIGSKHGIKAKPLLKNLQKLCNVDPKSVGDIRISKSSTLIGIRENVSLAQLSLLNSMIKNLKINVTLMN